MGVLAAGERWPDGGLRPAFEDLVGAGAVIAGIASAGSGYLSLEAAAAAAAFADAQNDIEERMSRCVSGQELIERSYGVDVDWSAALDVSDAVPVLVEGKHVDASGSAPQPCLM